MYITLEADYAVRIVSALSLDRSRLDAGTLSERSCVTLRFALKILRKLVSAGLVTSYKGSRGGYQLCMEPSEITLRMVIEAIEGTYYFSRCLSPDCECNSGADGICCYQKAFGEITDSVRKQLESYNFADLIASSEEFKGKANGQEEIRDF